MPDDATLMGAYEALYMIEEATPNVVPNAADWKRIVALKTFNPQMNLNIEPLLSAGSKRAIGFNQGGVYDTTFNLTMEATGANWLRFITMIFGSSIGTTEIQLPTFDLMRVIRRDVGGPNDFEEAQLLNGCIVQNAIIKKDVGNKALQLTISGRAQYITRTSVFSAGIPIWTSADFVRPVIGTLEALPDPDLRPVMWYDFTEKYQYSGESEVDMPRVAGWEMSITNGLAPIPGVVIGANGDQFPVWGGFGIEGQDVNVKHTIVPEDYSFFIAYKARKLIDKMTITHIAPPDYPANSGRIFEFQDGMWVDPNNIQLSELTQQTQDLMAKFQEVGITIT